MAIVPSNLSIEWLKEVDGVGRSWWEFWATWAASAAAAAAALSVSLLVASPAIVMSWGV